MDDIHDLLASSPVLPLLNSLLDAATSSLLRSIWANHSQQFWAHASPDIDLVERNPHWAVLWALEPGPDLPDEVEEDEERPGEV